MTRTSRVMAICIFTSIATQSILGAQMNPTPSNFYARNKKLINIVLGTAALAWATAIYLYSDKKIHANFKAKVKRVIDQESKDFSAEIKFTEDPRPLRVQPFPLSLNSTNTLISSDGKIKARIFHTTDRTLGVPVHHLRAYYTTNTSDFDKKCDAFMT